MLEFAPFSLLSLFSFLVTRIATHRKSIWASELLLQTVGESPRNGRLVRVEEAHSPTEPEECHDESTKLQQTFASSHMGILLRTENSQDFILLVNWLAEIPPLLLVPPVGIGVSELALDSGRVLVAAILCDPKFVNCIFSEAGGRHTIRGSSFSAAFRARICENEAWGTVDRRATWGRRRDKRR
jgi:hypothetical protein